jgi:ABC-type transport system involved in Fe-S cluster assembly fused permease/ATPase subunit
VDGRRAECDQIFVMRNVTIAERGTHHQLLARDGGYARMWDTLLAEQSAL